MITTKNGTTTELFEQGVVKTDRFDRRVFSQIYSTAAALPETAKKIPVPEPEKLLLDTWAGLYKPAPAFREDASPDLLLNRHILEQAMKIPEWDTLRDSSVLDEWASALGTIVMGEKYPELIPDEAKQKAEKAYDYQKKAQEFSALADALDMKAGQSEGEEREKIEKKAVSCRQRAAEYQQKASRFSAEAVEEAANRISKRSIREAVKSAASEVEDIQNKVASFSWGTSSGRHTYTENAEKFELALFLRNNDKMKRIAELAGKMKRIAMHKQKHKVRHVPSEIHHIEEGADLSRLLPVELLSLSNPVMKKDFYRRFTEKKLLQYRLRGKEAEGRGPIVVCLDSSASMEGNKEVWSKAVMLALFAVAAKQKRAFACIHFGSVSEYKTYEFPAPRRAKPTEVADMAGYFICGGTDFETPLNVALDTINNSSIYNKADIIFITDGQCRVSESFLEKFLKEKQEKQVSVISVLITDSGESGAGMYTLEPFSDHIFAVVPGDKEEEALTAMFSI